MNNEPLEREPIDRVRARLEALLKANAAPRCGARSKRTGKPCRGAAMPNGRCKFHGGKSTGPRTPEGLERSSGQIGNTGTFRGKPRRNGRACGRQYLCSAICATRSKGPRGPAVGFHTGPSISGNVESVTLWRLLGGPVSASLPNSLELTPARCGGSAALSPAQASPPPCPSDWGKVAGL